VCVESQNLESDPSGKRKGQDTGSWLALPVNRRYGTLVLSTTGTELAEHRGCLYAWPQLQSLNSTSWIVFLDRQEGRKEGMIIRAQRKGPTRFLISWAFFIIIFMYISIRIV